MSGWNSICEHPRVEIRFQCANRQYQLGAFHHFLDPRLCDRTYVNLRRPKVNRRSEEATKTYTTIPIVFLTDRGFAHR